MSTWDIISEREIQRMEENPHRVTASGKDEKGCLFEETVYKNRTDYKTGDLRKYDKQGNLVFYKMTYQYRRSTEEQIENTAYRYDNGTPMEAKIMKIHKKVREHFFGREEELLSESGKPCGNRPFLYQRTDVDFCEYEKVKKRVRTELYYHKGSTRRAHKKSTTYIYKKRGKERLAKEIRENDALLHEYRDIDKDHTICLTGW